MKMRFSVAEGFRSGVTLALLSVMVTAGCSRKPPATNAVVRPVKTMLIEVGDDSRTRMFPGRVEASNRVELAFQVSGVLTSLPVREGQNVTRGEVVAQLRQDEFVARLNALRGQLDRAQADLQALRAGARPEERLRLEAQLRAAEAQLRNAQAEFARSQQLFQNRVISALEHDRAIAAYSVAQENQRAAQQTFDQSLTAREEDVLAKEAEVRGLESRVVEANLQLEDSTLLAPYDGVIAQRFVEQGQSIRAQQPIVKFQDIEQIDIAVDIPESVMAAEIRTADLLELFAQFSAAPGLQFPVHVTEVAQRADPVTQTFLVRVAMESPEGVNLLPGMTATVSVRYRRALILGNQVLVPLAAVFDDAAGERAVWVIGENGSVSARPVKTGEASGGQIAILEGLEPGERIATAGVHSLREGMQVRDLGNALGDTQP